MQVAYYYITSQRECVGVACLLHPIMIRAVLHEDQSSAWTHILPIIQFSINVFIHTAHQVFPHEVLLSNSPQMTDWLTHSSHPTAHAWSMSVPGLLISHPKNLPSQCRWLAAMTSKHAHMPCILFTPGHMIQVASIPLELTEKFVARTLQCSKDTDTDRTSNSFSLCSSTLRKVCQFPGKCAELITHQQMPFPCLSMPSGSPWCTCYTQGQGIPHFEVELGARGWTPVENTQ